MGLFTRRLRKPKSPARRKARKGGLKQLPVPLPDIGQEAVLDLPGNERLDARATHADADEIVLTLMLRSDEELELGEIAAMALEYAAARGLVRLEGEGTVVDRDVVRFRLGNAVEIMQRREFVRVKAVRPMAIVVLDEEGRPGDWIDTLTVNVSGNGLLAAGPDTLEVDDVVRFRIRLEDGQEPITGEGHVSRVAAGGQRGIVIDQLPDGDRKRLVAFIFERERIARKRTRDGEL